METIERFTKDCIGHSASYNDEFYTIADVNEVEQLFSLKEMYNGKETFWVRTENTTYIPF